MTSNEKSFIHKTAEVYLKNKFFNATVTEPQALNKLDLEMKQTEFPFL